MNKRAAFKLLVAAGFLVFAVPAAVAQALSLPTRAFEEANEQYRQEQFARAIEGYEALLQQGWASGPLYYNLGNAYLKEGFLGKARWAYLRSWQQMPQDADLKANLEHLSTLLEPDALETPPVPVALQWLAGEGRVPIRTLIFWSVIFVWLGVIGRILTTWNEFAQKHLRPATGILILCAIWSLIALSMRAVWHQRTLYSVVIQDSADARYAPQEGGTTHFVLREGSIVRALDRQKEWRQVKRPDDRAGWVPAESLRDL